MNYNKKKIRLILDTSILVSALLKKKSILRDILSSNKIEFFAPEFIVEEIENNKEKFIKYTGLKKSEFSFVLYYLLRNVRIIKKEKFIKNLPKAKKIMEKRDINDAIFLALTFSIPNEGIFSEDKDFDIAPIKRWTVKEIIKYFYKT